MNRLHQWCCRSDWWSRQVQHQLVPWALDKVQLGSDTLEIGPGYGATTRALMNCTTRLTALELDPALSMRLRRELETVEITHGDGAAMPFDRESFDAAVCFTMLHHVPSAEVQDQIFAEAHRVLRPGGTFAGSDSLSSLRFRLFHIGDTCVIVNPAALENRLLATGFSDVAVGLGSHSFRFSARKPV